MTNPPDLIPDSPPNPREATPQDVPPAKKVAGADRFGLHDEAWSEEQWGELLRKLIELGLMTWKDVAVLSLGHLNPSQVGTSLASSKGFKEHYGKGKTMAVVMQWVYGQLGTCADCGTRLELQADHVIGKETFQNPLDADRIENMTLRCRRHNVAKRASHAFGGTTHLTTESALMWILLVIRPRTLVDFVRLCRLYGMTMADIRMNEAWAMAHWLAKADPPAYGIEDDGNSRYDLLLWEDGAITRSDVGLPPPAGARILETNVSGADTLTFIVRDDGRQRLYAMPIAFIPFSTYDLGNLPKHSLAIRYSPPDRDEGVRRPFSSLAPRGMELLAHVVGREDQGVAVESPTGRTLLPAADRKGRLLRMNLPQGQWRLIPIFPLEG